MLVVLADLADLECGRVAELVLDTQIPLVVDRGLQIHIEGVDVGSLKAHRGQCLCQRQRAACRKACEALVERSAGQLGGVKIGDVVRRHNAEWRDECREADLSDAETGPHLARAESIRSGQATAALSKNERLLNSGLNTPDRIDESYARHNIATARTTGR